MGWGFYLKPKLPSLFGGVPKGAVIAFADAPTGDLRRNCMDFGEDWVNFPASEGKFILGAGTVDNYDYQSGDTGGNPVISLDIQNMPEHNHSLVNGTVGHRIGGGDDNIGWGGSTVVNTHFAGEGQPFDNMPPYLILTYCKKIN